jgi:hypothetical protein
MQKNLVVTLSPKEHKRIFAKIAINPKTKCWNWTGSLDQQGYGLLWYKHRTERIHRVLYAFFVKPVPKGIGSRRIAQIDHICRNHSCCNPDHLELVTERENIIRGISPVAINAKKTHCNKGHLLLNKFRKNSTSRIYCPICDVERHKVRMAGPKRQYWLQKAKEATRRYRIKHYT